MIRIVSTRRHGIQVFVATITTSRCHRESIFLSEQGARDWVTRTLQAASLSMAA